ncbi:3-deoxy-D-manno-octulosonic acid transferase [Verticiella sediminum]
MRALYSAALALAAPLLWLGLARRARREGGDWQILGAGRFGRYDTPAEQGRLWVHAVSLGETRAAEPLLRLLLDAGVRVLLTQTTATARGEVRRGFAAELAEGRLAVAWLPYDFPGAVRRFLAHFRPCAGVLIEREIWPNLMAAAEAAQVPVLLVSARLSARSLRGMARLAPLMRPAFARLSATLAQTPADAERLRALGARDLSVMGNLKFDLAAPPALLARGQAWRAHWRRPVIVLASTRDGEEAMFIDAWQQQLAGHACAPLMLLVPRHPQRFDAVAALLAQRGLRFHRRSQAQADAAPQADASIDWLLGDSVGEMPAYYASADVAVIGGSFADFGGQNLVEASAVGTPVLVGPSTRNFAQAAEDAIAEGAAQRVPDAAAALARARELLADDAARAAMQSAAARFIAAHRGASARACAAILAQVPTGSKPPGSR